MKCHNRDSRTHQRARDADEAVIGRCGRVSRSIVFRQGQSRNAAGRSGRSDATGQLIAADHDDQTDEAYVYDLNGNRQRVDNDAASGQSYETGRYNRILSDDTYDYEYDAEGNRTKRTNISSGDYTEYEWDHRNRLVKITDKSVSNVTQQVVDQVYDTYNRWISRAVDTSSPFDMGDAAVTDFVHDGNQILLRLDDGELTHRYLWGQAVDQLLADEQYDTGDTSHDDPATETGKVLWPLADHLGTIRHHAEYDAINDETDVLNSITYDTYGNVTAETGSTNLLFGFTGRAFDEATGLQNNLNRWYDGSVGAWVSEDPIGFEAGDGNLSRYVSNQPSALVDPAGLAPFFGGEGWIPDYFQGKEGLIPDFLQGKEGNVPDFWVAPKPTGGTVVCDNWACMGTAALDRKSHIIVAGDIIKNAEPIIKKYVEREQLFVYCPTDNGKVTKKIDFREVVDFRSNGGGLNALQNSVLNVQPASLDLTLGRATVIASGTAELDVCCSKDKEKCGYSGTITLDKVELDDTFDFVPNAKSHGAIYNNLATAWEAVFNKGLGASLPTVSAQQPWKLKWKVSGTPINCSGENRKIVHHFACKHAAASFAGKGRGK